MVKLPPRSMTTSITCGRIMESMMWPERTSLAVCRVSLTRRGPRSARLAPKGRNSKRRNARLVPEGRNARSLGQGAQDAVDLGAQLLRCTARVAVEHDAAAGRQQRRGSIPVPGRLDRATQVTALGSNAGNQERELGGLAHVGDRLRSGGPHDQTDVAVAIQLFGQTRHVEEDRLAPRVEVL